MQPHKIIGVITVLSLFPLSFAHASDPLDQGKKALKSNTGCFLVDYSFVETEALKPGYVRSNQVYDVNKDKSVKEWIFAEDLSSTRIKLQHILFAVDLQGKPMEGSYLKHTGEDWQFNAPFLYDFTGPGKWKVKQLDSKSGQWTRKITSLDDGLRYQCAAAWSSDHANPEWTCDDYAPIPGRETRDMKRKDYQTLQRSTRIVSYGNSWLERENNVKTMDENGKQTPLVKEFGKNWYVRLPDSECAGAKEFVKPRLKFWELLQDVWDEVLSGEKPFADKMIPEHSRYEDIMAIEERYVPKDLNDPKVRKEAHDEILAVITKYRNEN